MHDPELLTQERKAAANIIRYGHSGPAEHGLLRGGPGSAPPRPATGREPWRALPGRLASGRCAGGGALSRWGRGARTPLLQMDPRAGGPCVLPPLRP